MLKAVVFDLDGTLLDTIGDIAAALNGALQRCALPTHSPEVVHTFVGGGIRSAIRAAAPENTPDGLLEQIFLLYREQYHKHCTEYTVPYPGIGRLLEQLDGAGLLLGVLTNKTEDTAREIISHFFPHIPFRCVHGRVDGRPLKPAAAAAAPVLEALDLPPDRIAYVGDSGTDMTFARNTGMIPVAVSWGYRSRKELLDCGAAHIARDASALGQLLTAL